MLSRRSAPALWHLGHTDRVQHLAQRLELRLQPVLLRDERLQRQLLPGDAIGIAARHGAGAHGGCVDVVHGCVCAGAAIFCSSRLGRASVGLKKLTARLRGADPPVRLASVLAPPSPS
jgi:hypothetical protein